MINEPLSDSKSYKTTCSYCGVGCGIVLHKDRFGKLKLEGDVSHPSNKGMLCSKGMNLHYTVIDQTDRLLYPQMRKSKNHPLQRVDWDTALNRAAAVFKTFIENHGPDSVAFYVSGQCLTEEYYIINKLIKGFIGSNNIDTNSRLCMSSAVVGYKMTLGEDAVPVTYADIELADTFFITGANPAWCHPIIFRRIEAHKAQNPDVKIIVVDPRKTQTAIMADMHLQINPGTDVELYNAIGRILIENDNIDHEFIKNHTEGFEDYYAEVMKKTLKESSKICGVKAEDIKWAATYIGRAEGFISMWTMGLNQSVIGVNKNLALIGLSLITGKIGKPGNGPFSLTGQPNAMGGREVGGLANLLPAHRELSNPLHRNEVQIFWGGKPISEKSGYTAVEMFDALHEGKLKAIWIVCTNPLVSMPNARKVEEALKKAKFVVVQDISNKTETISYADLVLPAAGWAEKEGTMTNSERRISYLNKVVDPPGEALPDTEIIQKFAEKLGYSQFFDYQGSEEIFNEHCSLTKGTNIDISGLSYTHLKQNGSVQWPFKHDKHSTERLFTDKLFYTPSKKAKLFGVEPSNQSEPLSEQFPLILTTGRIRDQWHTMTKTGKVNKLNQHIAEPFLEIHPIDAKVRNILEGRPVLVESQRGSVRVKAKVTADIKQGTVFLPMHWGKTLLKDFSRANNLTNPLYDPKSKEPDFKFCAVQAVAYEKPVEKILIIGAGAAAVGFIRDYRILNQTDEIHVFSKEFNPFYNRIMLPDYISGEQKWEQLIKIKKEEFEQLGIHTHIGVTVEHIDKTLKQIRTSDGLLFGYDKLILAMGSRANNPKDFPIGMKGLLNLRSKDDADNLVKLISKESKVIIIGGGLLGLELAASLRELEVKLTIIHRSSRLMDKQLDEIGSSLLHEEMMDREIEILYNNEIQNYLGKEKIEGIKLKSGKILPCDALIFAIGTIPNIELANQCGLDCKRGVIINDNLQTSDEHIYALGELAEHNGTLYGITAGAEQQAGVLAKFLNGDLFASYHGTVLMNILKMPRLNLCSMGITDAPNKTDYEEIVFIDKAKRFYKKCIVHQDKLVGAILIGDKNEFSEFKELISNKIELSEKRMVLLRSGKIAEPVIGKLVCSCNNVGEGNIKSAIRNGEVDLNQISIKTGAGTGCGSCKPEIKAILEQFLKK